jgi:hypothetical protein
MLSVTSRDLVHRSKEIRKLLASGQTLRWTSHGSPVAIIQPVTDSIPSKPDWIARARASGAVNTSQASLAKALYDERG